MPERKKITVSPQKRLIDVVEKYLQDLGVLKWKDIVQNRGKWNDLALVDKTLGGY